MLELFCIAKAGEGSEFLVDFAKHLTEGKMTLVIALSSTIGQSSAPISIELAIPVV